MVKIWTLANGIRVIAVKLSGFKSLSMGIYVGVGSSSESRSERGISHFIEHVNFKGTNKRTAFDISRDPELLGVMINAATSREYTYYYAKTIAEHTEETLEILADIFNDSVYPKTELEKEKGVITEEINMYSDTPDDVCLNNLNKAIYGDGAGYGNPILGTKSNVKGFTKNFVLAYREKYYTTDSTVLAFAGELDFENIKDLCDKYFGDTKASRRTLSPERNVKNLCGRVVAKKDIEQEHVALGFTAPKTDGETYEEYRFIVSALGGGMSSRLFQSIREDLGLCYNIEAFLQTYVDCGAWIIYSAVGLGASGKTLSAIESELKKFKENGITEEEFRCVKEQVRSALVFSEESTTSVMNAYARKLLLQNEIYDADKRLAAVNALDIDRVNRVIKENFDIYNFALSKVVKK